MRQAAVTVAAIAAAQLAACTPVDTPEACRLTPVASVPIVLSHNQPLIDLAIDGKPVRLMLDTGAQVTVIGQPAAARLALGRDYTTFNYIRGLGAAGATWPTQKATVTIGALDLDPEPLAVADFSGKTAFDGVLGLRTLARFDLDIDMPARKLTLYTARHCPGGPPPFTPSTTLPASSPAPNRVVIPVTIDDTVHPMMVDTGASRTLIDRNRAGLSDADLAADAESRTITVDPVGLGVHTHRFKRLLLGADAVANPALLVGDAPATGYDGLAGADLWRSRRLWLSPTSQTVTIAPRRTATERPPATTSFPETVAR